MLDDEFGSGELLIEDEQIQEEGVSDSDFIIPDNDFPGDESSEFIEDVSEVGDEIFDSSPDMVGEIETQRDDAGADPADQTQENDNSDDILQILQTIERDQRVGFNNVTLVLTVHSALICFIIGALVIWSFLHKLG